jgi:hypothetical protein
MRLRTRGLLLLFAVLLLAGLILALTPWGQQKVPFDHAQMECFSGGHEIPWKVCLFTAQQGTNGGLAYYLHGIHLNEKRWDDDAYYTAMIQKSWADKEAKPPMIAGVSFGQVWLLTPPGKHKANGLLKVFTDEIVPAVESRTGKPSYRDVFGESMGGLNSLLLAFKTQGLFSRVASICPPVYKDSPFVSFPEIVDFLWRTGADPKILLTTMSLIRNYVSTTEEWEAISPAALVDRPLPNPMPELYLSGNLYDRYGNFEGAEYLAKRAIERGVRLHWHPLFGNHCVADPTSIADFLLNTPI